MTLWTRKSSVAAAIALAGTTTALMLLPRDAEAAKKPKKVVLYSVELEQPDNCHLMAGDTVGLSYTVFNAETHQEVTGVKPAFKVTPTTSGKVSPKDVFQALRAGSVSVKAFVGKGPVSDPITFQINEIKSIRVTPGSVGSLNVGDTMLFRAEAIDASGHTLPNEEWPDVNITWKAFGGATINENGAVTAKKKGKGSVQAFAGRKGSTAVPFLILPREDSSSTHVYLTGWALADVFRFGVSIEGIELQDPHGEWHPAISGEEIDALVGQPIDLQKLNNKLLRIGTLYLPNGDYTRMRVTFAESEGDQVLQNTEAEETWNLSFNTPESRFVEFGCYLGVFDENPTNLVFDVLGPRCLLESESGETLFAPVLDWQMVFDDELSTTIGSLIGQIVTPMSGMNVYARTPDTGDTLTNYFGSLDLATGDFRVGQLPPGSYELMVSVPGEVSDRLITTFTVTAGHDTLLDEPVLLFDGDAVE